MYARLRTRGSQCSRPAILSKRTQINRDGRGTVGREIERERGTERERGGGGGGGESNHKDISQTTREVKTTRCSL